MLSDVELETVWRLSETAACIPGHRDVVHNDECLFTFTTPLSKGGLFVNLKTWKGVSREYLSLDVEANNGTAVYLWMRHHSRPKENVTDPEKLAIGLPGGFDTSTTETVKQESVVVIAPPVLSFKEFVLDDENLPEPIAEAARAVSFHKGANEQHQVDAWEALDERPVSRFADSLIQDPASDERKTLLADPSRWKCEVSGDTHNLWLNLSDGFIGGGRRNFDGSGGSNGAIDHFNDRKQKEGKVHPLAVKLGTITPDGSAEVYSYEEDCLVTDPLLKQHLAHWGIDPSKQSKTEKTLAEMEVQLNKDFAFDKIVEAGEQLEPVSGIPGMTNLGNTCYINSVMQLVTQVPELRDRYRDDDGVMRRMLGKDLLGEGEQHPVTRTLFELSKCVNGQLSGDNVSSLSMHAFRNQLTSGHPEFSSSRQQDAVEFLLHLIKELTKAERALMTANLTENLFSFQIEDKLACDGRVKYARRSELVLPVQVTLDDLSGMQTKRARSDDSSAPLVDFTKCLTRVLAPSKLDGFRSPITGQVSDDAYKSSGIASMPPYLLVSVNRYYFNDRFEAEKLNCAVAMPEQLSLEVFRSQGIQPGEQELPDDGKATSGLPGADAEMVSQLVMMGFPEALASQACSATKNVNAEVALQWCLENPDGKVATNGGSFDANAIEMLAGMGFSEKHARMALEATSGNAERAADWLLSRMDQLDSLEETATPKEVNDGVGEYEIMGVVSHLGKSTNVGHYVAHIKRDGQWLIFNDTHVAKSHKPPLNYGYLYLYRRIE
jgi:ubiquitin carboxyl-terminal hydrolase 5/13